MDEGEKEGGRGAAGGIKGKREALSEKNDIKARR